MSLPRVSIATLMGAVVILAVDIALLREGFSGVHAVFYLLGIAPMANLVMASMIAEAVRLGRCGVGNPFWTGFISFGWVAMLVSSSYVLLTRVDPDWKVMRAVWLVLGRTNYDRLIGTVSEIVIVSFVCTLPQVMFACFGGWLFGTFGLVIVRHSRDAPCPER